MGQPKAFAKVRGEGLLERTVRLLASLVGSRIIVVIPPRSSRLRALLRRYGLDFIENPQRAEGLSTSVRRALRRSRYRSAALLLPLDLVELTRRDLERLITRWRGSRRRIVARDANNRGVAPLILPRRFYVRGAGISGERGLRDFVNQLPEEDVVLMNLPSAIFDVDTPRDLELARRRGHRRQRG
jgi:molybdenum cofactor cytidylyltransferase